MLAYEYNLVQYYDIPSLITSDPIPDLQVLVEKLPGVELKPATS